MNKKEFEELTANHKCGREGVYTWQTPVDKQLWLMLKFPGLAERSVYINFCPFCGYETKGEKQENLIGYFEEKN